MATDLIDAATLRTKRFCSNNMKSTNSPRALYTEARYLIIRLPSSKFMKICYRSLILLLALASFPMIIRSSSFLEEISSSSSQASHESVDHVNMDQFLPALFRDLTNEGLMKQQQRVVFMNNDDQQQSWSHVVDDYSMEVVALNDVEKQNAVKDNTVDFVFTTDFPAALEFIERTLKVDGVVTVVLKNNPTAALYKPSNYKVAYMRRMDLIAVAMKKEEPAVPKESIIMAAPRKLFGHPSEAKKAALENLEDVLLEPPRAASGKSRQYLKRTRYLPDLMGDSLESYPRRVFIDVGLPEKDGGSGTDWFPKNYPTRNKNFEIYKIETVAEESSGKEVPQTGMSGWLRKNVKEEEYVVMKAEAEVVEEMMRSNSIGLVDELFLECKPHGKQGGMKNNNGNNRSRRAYWECLALYGKLRDEGVAVHQWWG